MTSCKIEKQDVIFSESDLAGLDKSNIPYHVAIIPDGNRRWAKGELKAVGTVSELVSLAGGARTFEDAFVALATRQGAGA